MTDRPLTPLQRQILAVLPGPGESPMTTSRVARKITPHGLRSTRRHLPTATALRGLEKRGLVEWGYRERYGDLVKEWRRTRDGA